MFLRASMGHTSSFKRRNVRKPVPRNNQIRQKPKLTSLTSEKNYQATTKSQKLYSELEMKTIEKYIFDVELALGHFAIYQNSKELKESMNNLKSCTRQLREFLTDDTAHIENLSLQDNTKLKKELTKNIETYYS